MQDQIGHLNLYRLKVRAIPNRGQDRMHSCVCRVLVAKSVFVSVFWVVQYINRDVAKRSGNSICYKYSF